MRWPCLVGRYSIMVSFDVFVKGMGGFLCQKIFWELARVGGAMLQHSFSILFCPEFQRDVEPIGHLIVRLIIIDGKSYVRAAAIFITTDQADGLSCFDDLTGMDKGAVFFYAVSY